MLFRSEHGVGDRRAEHHAAGREGARREWHAGALQVVERDILGRDGVRGAALLCDQRCVVQQLRVVRPGTAVRWNGPPPKMATRFWISFCKFYRSWAKWANFAISEIFRKISDEKNKPKFEF